MTDWSCVWNCVLYGNYLHAVSRYLNSPCTHGLLWLVATDQTSIAGLRGGLSSVFIHCPVLHTPRWVSGCVYHRARTWLCGKDVSASWLAYGDCGIIGVWGDWGNFAACFAKLPVVLMGSHLTWCHLVQWRRNASRDVASEAASRKAVQVNRTEINSISQGQSVSFTQPTWPTQLWTLQLKHFLQW